MSRAGRSHARPPIVHTGSHPTRPRRRKPTYVTPDTDAKGGALAATQAPAPSRAVRAPAATPGATALRATPRRDIFEAVWALFCSVRFAVVLMLLLAAATTLGTLIPQVSPGLRDFPQDYADFLSRAYARFGARGGRDGLGRLLRPLQQLLVPPADHPDLLQHRHLHAEPLGADHAADQPADGPQQRGLLAGPQ